MLFIQRLFRHLQAIHFLLPSFDAIAEMDVSTFEVRISGRSRSINLLPQFIIFIDGQRSYSPVLTPNSYAFAGWRPYFNKRWPAGSSKSQFKEYCATHNILTPKSWSDPGETTVPFIIKPFNGSFGRGIQGPFPPKTKSESFSAETQYCEQFINGRSLKAWYWDNRLACVQIQDFPSVIGNGRNSIRQLIEQRCPTHLSLESWSKNVDWKLVSDFCNLQGYDLDVILQEGEKVSIEYRYGGVFTASEDTNLNALNQLAGSPIEMQLREKGSIFWQSIPEQDKLASLYTVDAVIDDSNTVWFLEMNCNPITHPDIYRYMFEGFFGLPSNGAGPRSRPAP